jgi:hypothetical protein
MRCCDEGGMIMGGPTVYACHENRTRGACRAPPAFVGFWPGSVGAARFTCLLSCRPQGLCRAGISNIRVACEGIRT